MSIKKPNIITIAWTGTICSDPAMVSISVRKERYSHDIIKRTGEFVINLTTEKLAFATDYCGVRSGRDVDKFKEQKLTPEESKVVKCPSIAESPVNIECKVTEIKELGSHDMFIAEIVNVNVDEDLMDELVRIEEVVKPHEELLVIDAMMGQDAINVITGFNDKLKLSGCVLTKMDGDTKGGVALSLRHLTNIPIKLIGEILVQ